MMERKFIASSVTTAAGTIILPTIVPASVIGKIRPVIISILDGLAAEGKRGDVRSNGMWQG